LPQLDASGQDPGGRRFRIENGDSLGEKEEVIIIVISIKYLRYISGFSLKIF